MYSLRIYAQACLGKECFSLFKPTLVLRAVFGTCFAELLVQLLEQLALVLSEFDRCFC